LVRELQASREKRDPVAVDVPEEAMSSSTRHKWNARRMQDEMHAADVEDRRARILIVDDDMEMRSFLSDVLEQSGYEVIQASDGLTAIAVLEDELHDSGGDHTVPIDAVVTDLRMPGATGLEVLEYLRHHDWSTGVILISGFASRELVDEALRMGAAKVLAKPFSLLDFLGAVQAVARGA
jgi:DNA-binding response OmpR family regulator